MTRSPLAATALVVFFVIAVPAVLIRRLTDGLLPTQAYDVALAVGFVAWVLIAKAILDRDQVMTSLVTNRLSPTWQAHRLVEQSLFGVGLLAPSPPVAHEVRLAHLQSPQLLIDEHMPSPAEPLIGRTRHELGQEGRQLAQPTLAPQEPADPPILETEEYVVVRSDTFWSIAEERLNDGRRWKAVERLNLGREVAPGVIFCEGDSPRIGWSILIPAEETQMEPSS